MGVSVNHLTIRIGGAPIVSDVHIDVRDGQRVGLIGSSGSGKSMIARAMMGLLPVEATVSGSIDVNGEQIVGMQDRDLAALRGAAISMVFQNPGASLNPLLTVGRQIALPLELHYDLANEDRQARVLAMMRKVGLDESLVGRHPHELSGGQQQRVGIATALITSPRLIIADEPTTGRAQRLHAVRDSRDVGLVGVLRVGGDAVHHTRLFGARARHAVLLRAGPRHDCGAGAHAACARRAEHPAGRAPRDGRARTDIARSGRRRRRHTRGAGAMTGALTQAEQTDVLLQGERVCKVFGPARARHQVLFDVDISVPAGQCVAIIGASGSGKSTLTRILLGLETPDGGDVRYRGASIEGRAGAPQLRVLRDESGIVYQNPFESLDPRWTAFRSVAEPLRLRDRRIDDETCERRVREALTLVSLDPDEIMWRYPMDLSGGQAQRVAIARAIVTGPSVLLADEAMSAIDVAARVQILDAFAAIRARNPRMAMLFVSHDLGVVQHIADRVLVLHEGRVVERGTVRQILETPQEDYTKALIEAATL